MDPYVRKIPTACQFKLLMGEDQITFNPGTTMLHGYGVGQVVGYKPTSMTNYANGESQCTHHVATTVGTTEISNTSHHH